MRRAVLAKAKEQSLTPTQRAALAEAMAAIRDEERRYGEATLTIINKQGASVKFADTAPQRLMEEVYTAAMQQLIRLLLLVLKYRQAGSTTWWSKKIHTRTISRFNHKSFICAHRDDRAREIMKLQKEFLSQMPDLLRPSTPINSQTQVEIQPQNSVIYCGSAQDPDAMRGFTPPPKTVLFTEAAHYEGKGGSFGALATSGLQAVPNMPDCLVAAETTGNGTDEEFYEYFIDASENGNPVWQWLFLEWFLDEQYETDFHDHSEDRARPGITWGELRQIRDNCSTCREYRRAFYEAVLAKDPDLLNRMRHHKLTYEQMNWYYLKLYGEFKGDRPRMRQEYPCTKEEAFISSGSPMFDSDILNQVLRNCHPGKLYELPMDCDEYVQLTPNSQLRRGQEPYLEIWEPPSAGRRYLVVIDSSEGRKKSNPTATFVIDIEAMRVCAHMHGLIEPEPLADYGMNLGRMYNTALMVIERNNSGLAVINRCINENYPDIYQKHILKVHGWDETEVIGWETNVQTKPWIVAVLRNLLNAYRTSPEYLGEILRCQHVIKDLLRFTRGKATTTGRAEHGAEDDRPMALMIGLGVCFQELGLTMGGDVDQNVRNQKTAKERRAEKRRADMGMENKPNTNLPYDEWNEQRKKFFAGRMAPGDFMDDNGEIVSDFDDDDDY
jgi:hypothetical protein